MSKHSKFSPSAAERWLNCSACIQLSAGLKDKASIFAMNGSAAHKLAEKYLTKKIKILKKSKYLDADDIKAVKIYIDFVKTLDARFLDVEVRLKHEDLFTGTADCVCAEPFGLLHVVDYKHGSGKFVDVIDNPQLAIYALMTIEKYSVDFENLKITVVQPRHRRGPKIRSWEISEMQKFYDFWYEKTHTAIEKALGDNPEPSPGDYCAWCLAKFKCPALRDLTHDAAKKAFSTDIKKSENIEIQELDLKWVLDNEKKVIEYFKAVKIFALQTLKNGGKIDGYGLKTAFKNTCWIDKNEAFETFKDVPGATETKLKSITKLKEIDVDLVDSLTHRPESGLKITTEDKADVDPLKVFKK